MDDGACHFGNLFRRQRRRIVMDDMTEEALETIEAVSNEEFDLFRDMFLDMINGLPDEAFSAIMPKISDIGYSLGLLGNVEFERIEKQAQRCIEIDNSLFSLCKMLLADKAPKTTPGEVENKYWMAAKKKGPEPGLDESHDQLVGFGLRLFGHIGEKKLYTGPRSIIESVDISKIGRLPPRCFKSPISLFNKTANDVVSAIKDDFTKHFIFVEEDADMFRVGGWLDKTA